MVQCGQEVSRVLVMSYGCGVQRTDWHVDETRATQYARIYLIDDGEVEYIDENGSATLEKGKLYIFPTRRPYRLHHNQLRPISCLWMHADVFPYIVQELMVVNPARHPDIESTLSLLRRQVLFERTNHACIEAFALALLQLFVRDDVLRHRVESVLFDPAWAYSSCSVEEMSERAGYSVEHYIRAFSKSTGMTPYQYLIGQRMNEAVSLMSQGLTLDEVASRVGYASGKSFAGAFKRRFGIPPHVYRERFLRKA